MVDPHGMCRRSIRSDDEPTPERRFVYVTPDDYFEAARQVMREEYAKQRRREAMSNGDSWLSQFPQWVQNVILAVVLGVLLFWGAFCYAVIRKAERGSKAEVQPLTTPAAE